MEGNAVIYRFSHPEWFDRIEKPRLTPEDTIILWGAGKIGSVTAHAVEKRGLDIKAFVDSAKDKQGKTFCGYKIISPEELYEQYSDAAVIVSCAYPNVYQELVERGFKRVYDPHSFLMEIDFNGYAGGLTQEFAIRITQNTLENYAMYFGTGRLIDKLYFVITDKCTLNCKNCDGYIPYHKDPKNDTADTIFACYQKVMKACEYVESIDIFGGEPLVHPDVAEITSHFVADSRCSHVSIITNGTIVPSQDLIEVMRSPKCFLRVSDYGEYSHKKAEIVHLCSKEHINCEVTNYTYWDRVPVISKTNETPLQLDKKYAECVRNYFYIKHGKLFQCTFTLGLSNLGEQLLPNFERNYVDLLQTDEAKVVDEIKSFAKQIHEQRHIDACKYCPGSHCIHFEDKVPVAEQAKGKLPIDLLFKDGVRLCD